MYENYLIIDILGLELTHEDRELLKHPKVGGVILFTRNYQNKQQLLQLNQSIKELRSDLLIAVDYEGGRVQRFHDDFTKIPEAGYFGKLYIEDPLKARAELKHYATLVASELKEMLIDVNFAPVLDIDYGVSKVIGNRSFSSVPEIVAKLGCLYIETLQQNGVKAVAKHFPGHGGVTNDTHVTLAHDNRELETIFDNDLVPFQAAIAKNVYGIMPSHVIYDEIDSLAAGFSEHWLKQILRERLKFNGLIFSDDITMQATAAVGDITTRVHLARKAGCDMVLVCNDRKAVLKLL